MPKRQTKNQKAYQKEIQRLDKYAQELSKKTGKIFVVPTMYSEIPSRVTKKRLKDISSIDKDLFSKIATRIIKKTGEIKEKSKKQISGYRAARTRESRGYKPNISYLNKSNKYNKENIDYEDYDYDYTDIADNMEHWIKDIISHINNSERREFLFNQLIKQELAYGKKRYYSNMVFVSNLEEAAIEADSSNPIVAYNGMRRILSVIYYDGVPEEVLILAEFTSQLERIEQRRQISLSKRAQARWAMADFS